MLKTRLFELVSFCCGDLPAVSPDPAVVVAVVVDDVSFVVAHDVVHSRLSFCVHYWRKFGEVCYCGCSRLGRRFPPEYVVEKRQGRQFVRFGLSCQIFVTGGGFFGVCTWFVF